MSNGTHRYTTFFNSIAAGDVHVPGLPAGSAGSRGIPTHALSTIAALFTIGPDTARILHAARRFMPACPATQSDALLAAD